MQKLATVTLLPLTADCLQRLPRCPLLLDLVEPRLHIIKPEAAAVATRGDLPSVNRLVTINS